jgi:cell division topological specificity factor
MSWLSVLFARNKASASLAKQRLQIVISQERAARGGKRPPDYLLALQRELQLVVAKYVQVEPRDVAVRFGHPRHAPESLEVRIELPQPVHA